MKRIALIALLIASGLLLVAALPGAAKPAPGFAGKWVGEDPDGSTVRYHFKIEKGSEGTVFHIKYTDDLGSAFDDEPVRGHGFGVLLNPAEMETSLVFWGLRSSEAVSVPPPGMIFTYDSATDTMIDPIDTVFDRAGKK